MLRQATELGVFKLVWPKRSTGEPEFVGALEIEAMDVHDVCPDKRGLGVVNRGPGVCRTTRK